MALGSQSAPFFGAAGAAGGATGYEIERSLRFNSADSAYLDRTPASAGNRKTWTWAGWVKLCAIPGSYAVLFGAGAGGSDSDLIRLNYESSGKLNLAAWNTDPIIRTAAVYRDFSAWYHIVVAVDTTNATASNRAKIYINGTEATYDSDNRSSISNLDTPWNSNVSHAIGRLTSSGGQYVDAYFADVYSIDGQALDATSFGEFDATTAVWNPIDYTGSYGTNGFHLPFADNSSAAALGTDTSVTIPDPAPKGGMDVVTYTGNSTARELGGLQFQPDFVWIKDRSSNNTSHALFDSVRGTGALQSNSNSSEASQGTPPVGGYVSNFNADGFSLANGSTNNTYVNQSGYTYVAWCWKAGGAAVTNTNGSINSQVSADQDYGFSIVTYTGNGNASQSFGHGLSAAPKLVIIKNRDSNDNWRVYHADVGNTKALNLNLSSAPATGTGYWQNSSPTSSVVNIGLDSGVNTNTHDHVAYCWTEIAGFSKIGTYTGSGSSSVKVTTGFKPRFILARPIDHSDGNRWNLIDTKRGVTSERLFAEDSTVHSARQEVEVLDDGFNVINTTPDSGSLNRNTQYIYAAFADNPGNDWDVNNLVATGSNNTLSSFSHTGYSQSDPSSNFLDGDDSSRYRVVADPTNTETTASFTFGTSLSGTLEVLFQNGNNGVTGKISIDGGTSFTSLPVTASPSWISVGTISGNNVQIRASFNSGGGSTASFYGIRVNGTRVITSFDDATVDSLRDSPTNGDTADDTGLGNEVSGNYATWNPLFGKNLALSNGNLKAESTSSYATIASTLAMTSGKWYMEYTYTANSGVFISFGVSQTNRDGSAGDAVTDTAQDFGFKCWDNGFYSQSAGFNSHNYSSSVSTGDIISLAFDADNGKLWVAKNGSWMTNASGTGDPASGANPDWSSLTYSGGYFFMAGPYYSGNSSTLEGNFGQRAFAYSAPSGYKALCTANLDDPTIADGSTAMDVLTWSGTGGARSFTDLAFSPDLVWGKQRNGANSHQIYDTVRGAGNDNDLASDLTAAEGSATTSADVYGYLSSFDSNGFSVANGTDGTFGAGYWNHSGRTYVAWTWDGGSSTVSNTDGSITSSVRANASAGFSIVTWTMQSSGNSTVGHGLNVAPSFWMVKNRTGGSANWGVYHSAVMDNNKFMNLNDTAGVSTYSNIWGTAVPTSTVFGVSTAALPASSDCVGYFFAPVESYSAFGSYQGNGSDDGPFVFCNFRPRWILIKAWYAPNPAALNGWTIYDTALNGYNESGQVLYASSSTFENTHPSLGIDIVSNGFKLKADAHGYSNYSGNSYIYAAFAENPFKYARAR